MEAQDYLVLLGIEERRGTKVSLVFLVPQDLREWSDPQDPSEVLDQRVSLVPRGQLDQLELKESRVKLV